MRIPVLTLLAAILVSATSVTRSAKAPDSYQVFIIQDSVRKEVMFNAQEIRLKKKPFTIEVWLKDSLEGVFVNISYRRMYYDTPADKRFHDWENIVGKTMAEDAYNKDRDIAISADAICYWYYTPGETHRFDPAVKIKNGAFVGTQTVESITDVDRNKHYSVKKISAPLYFVFFNYDTKPEDVYTPSQEYGRKRVKVSFE